MTFFTASIQTVVIRFYLMMAVIVLSFAFGYPILTFLGFPLFLSAMTAVSFGNKSQKTSQQKNSSSAKEIILVNTAA